MILAPYTVLSSIWLFFTIFTGTWINKIPIAYWAARTGYRLYTRGILFVLVYHWAGNYWGASDVLRNTWILENNKLQKDWFCFHRYTHTSSLSWISQPDKIWWFFHRKKTDTEEQKKLLSDPTLCRKCQMLKRSCTHLCTLSIGGFMPAGVKRPGMTLCTPRARLSRIKAVTAGNIPPERVFQVARCESLGAWGCASSNPAILGSKSSASLRLARWEEQSRSWVDPSSGLCFFERLVCVDSAGEPLKKILQGFARFQQGCECRSRAACVCACVGGWVGVCVWACGI